MKKQLYLLMFSIFLLSLISAIPQYYKNDNVVLTSVCENCTSINVTKITYPSKTNYFVNYEMTKFETNFNYTFTDTSQEGIYNYVTCGDLNGVLTCNDNQERSFEIISRNNLAGFNIASTLGIVLMIIMFIIAGILVFTGHNLFGGIIVIILGFIMLLNNVNSIFSFIVIAVGVIAGVSGGNK